MLIFPVIDYFVFEMVELFPWVVVDVLCCSHELHEWNGGLFKNWVIVSDYRFYILVLSTTFLIRHQFLKAQMQPFSVIHCQRFMLKKLAFPPKRVKSHKNRRQGCTLFWTLVEILGACVSILILIE